MSKLLRAIQEGVLFERIYIKAKSLKKRSYLQYMFVPALRSVETVYRHNEVQEGDEALVARLLTAFDKARLDEPMKHTRDLWDGIQTTIHTDFYEIQHDPALVAAYLANLSQHGLAHGVTAGNKSESDDMKKYPSVLEEWGSLVMESLERFPYDTEFLQPAYVDGGMFKVKYDNMLLDYRDVWSAATAFLLRENKAQSVGEIGGGVGKTALYATRLGMPYTIYDLPIMNLVQGWYLLKSGLAVVLYGEEGVGVQVLPYWLYKGTEDITLNIDGFPEMAESIVRDYLLKAQGSRRLLSINQEDAGAGGVGSTPIQVSEIIKEQGVFKRLYRAPFRLRKGYYTEVYDTEGLGPVFHH